MIERLLAYLDEHKVLKRIISGFLVVLYTTVITLAFYAFEGNFILSGLDDSLLQQGQAASDKVIVIGVTDDDLRYYNEDPSVILAKVAKTINDKATPATLTFDVSINSLKEDALELLKETISKDNLIMPLELIVPEGIQINDYGNYTKDISETQLSRTNNNILLNATFGHTIRIMDKGGILRRAVLNVETADTTYKSIAYVSYEEYCNALGLYSVYPSTNDDNVMIKFVNRDEFLNSRCMSVRDFYSFLNTEAGATSFFDDKMVFLGYMSSSLDNGYLTAIDHENIMYGVEFDAQVASALMTKSTNTTIPQWIQALGFALPTVLLLLIVVNKNGWIGLCFAFIYALMNRVVTLALFGMGYSAFSVPHYATAVLTVLVAGIYTYIFNLIKRKMATDDILKHYIGSNIVKSITKEGTEKAEEVKNKTNAPMSTKLTILFADIRGFTSISEKLTPEQLVCVLNEYLSMMAECVERNKGTVDKFIGDCVMAYWGAPEEDPEGCYHACQAAYQMQRRCSREVPQRVKEKYGLEVPIRIGIGINTGQAVVGDIGSKNRLNFTALGDAVNTSQRMESVAPPGCIYISEAVLKEVQTRSEVEELPEKMTFKGKAEPQTVYSLKGLRFDRELERKAVDNQTKVYQRRAAAGIIINVVLLLSNALYILNSLRTYGMAFVNHYSILMACVASFASATSLPFLVTSFKRHDGKSVQPKWVDLLRISALIGGLYTMSTFLCFLVPKVGWAAAITNEYWPGGVWFNIICPVLYCVLFFACETKQEYKLSDVFIAEIPLVVIRFAGFYITTYFVEGYVDLTGSREVFYLFPGVALSTIGEMLAIVLVLSVNEILRKKEDIFVNRKSIIELFVAKYQTTKLHEKLQQDRYKSVLFMIVDIGMLASCVKGILSAYLKGGLLVLNYVVLLLIPIAICCIIMFVYNLNAIIKNREDKDQSIYRYTSFVRQYLWLLEFATAAIFAMTQGGLSAFFSTELGGDFAIFVVWPLLAFLIFIEEQNEYKLPIVLAFTLLPIGILFLAKYGLEALGSASIYEAEYANYYTPTSMILLPLSEILLVVIVYYINEVCKKLYIKRNSSSVFTICGTRSDNTTLAASLSSYGNNSECMVLRDKEYAIVINAGSGILNAKQALYGCSNVDFVVTTPNPEMRLGFMYKEELCQYAKFRVISPFDEDMFVESSTWNKKLKKKKNWIKVPDNQSSRLSDDYEIEMIPMESDPTKRMVKIKGRTDLFYAPNMNEDLFTLQDMASDADYLICDDMQDYQKACYLAIDCQVPNVLITGFSTATNDIAISDAENKAKKILENVRFAREEVLASK